MSRIIGMGKLRRKLRDLPAAMRPELAKAVQTSGRDLAATAKALVPVANTPGKIPLKNTITHRVTDNGLGFEVSAGGNAKRTIIQAHAVEGGRSPGSEKGAMEAQPYLNPAKRLMMKKIRGRLSRAINKAAKRVAAGGN